MRFAEPAAGDHAGVWSVTCFHIGRKSRRQGVSAALLLAAVDFAAGRGARRVSNSSNAGRR
ncbi:hypothetical protein ACFWIW_37270 [Amycolatopsis sp. NPDC058340]|uniref:hypothetical protein n=1 Tax=Amycolatopsis sp. NPDC058340 TaxID=3346453 RepID=UPI003657C880